MELTKQLEMLKELCTLDGVSGCEERVAEYLRAHLPQDCQVRQDIRGNLICEKKGRQTPKNKLMFTAHMDEVGFLIHYIEDSGLLRFAAVGNVDTRVVIGKPVRLESGKERQEPGRSRAVCPTRRLCLLASAVYPAWRAGLQQGAGQSSGLSAAARPA